VRRHWSDKNAGNLGWDKRDTLSLDGHVRESEPK
jgi:hypothetical protein